MFSSILKFNPNHGSNGQFSSSPGSASRAPSFEDHPALAWAARKNKRQFSDAEVVSKALGGDKALIEEFNSVVSRVKEKAKAGEESYRTHVKNLEALDENPKARAAYTKERLKLHNQIINEVLKDADKYKPKEGEKPEVIFLGGRGGSGKSHFNKDKNPTVGVYSTKTHLLLDPDEIKQKMPGYNPEEAYLVHRESSDIYHKIVVQARHRGINLALDATMKSNMQPMVNNFKKSGYKMQAHYMHLSPDGAAMRAISRWKGNTTDANGKPVRGRLVPPNVVYSMVNNEKNFDAILPKMDSWSMFANDRPMGQGPRKLADSSGFRTRAKKAEGGPSFMTVLKHNPYHDAHGRFTSYGKEGFVSSWGKDYAKLQSNGAKNIEAVKHHAKVLQGIAAALGTHLKNGGTLEDKFGKNAFDSAKLHEEAIKVYSNNTSLGRSAATAHFHQVVKSIISTAYAKSDLSPAQKEVYGLPLTDQDKKNLEAASVSTSAYAKKAKVAHLKKAQEAANQVAMHDAAKTLKGVPGLAYEHYADNLKQQKILQKYYNLAKKNGASQEELDALHENATKMVANYLDDHLDAYSGIMHNLGKTHTIGTHPEGADNGALGKEKEKYAELMGKDTSVPPALAKAAAAYVHNQWYASMAEDQHKAEAKAFHAMHLAQQYGADSTAALSGKTVAKSAMASLEHKHGAGVAKNSADYIQSVGKFVTAFDGAVPASHEASTENKASSALGVETPGAVRNISPTFKPPKTVEEAESVMKLAGKNFYDLKQGKYHGTVAMGSDTPPELAAAYKMYSDAKDHYLKLGGDKNTNVISSQLKAQANLDIQAKKDQLAIEMGTASKAYKSAVQGYEAAKLAHGENSTQAKNAKLVADSAKEVAGKYFGDSQLDTYHKEAISEHLATVSAQKKKALEDVKSAYGKLQMAQLQHPDDTSHPEVVKAAKAFDTASKNAGVKASKEEISSAMKAGKTVAQANHKAMKEVEARFPSAARISSDYDNASRTFRTGFSSEIQAHANSMIGRLTVPEVEDIKAYTGADYRPINKAVSAATAAVREGKEPPHIEAPLVTSIHHLDAALNRTTIGQDVTLTRNFAQRHFWKGMGISEGDAKAATSKELKDQLVGRIYQEDSFVSTSLDPKWSGAFSVAEKESGRAVLHIRAGAKMPGLAVEQLSSHSSENEVILPRGSAFMVRNVVKKGTAKNPIMHIYADMVGAHPTPLSKLTGD